MEEAPEHQETARKEILLTGTAKQRQEHLLKKIQMENNAGGYIRNVGG